MSLRYAPVNTPGLGHLAVEVLHRERPETSKTDAAHSGAAVSARTSDVALLRELWPLLPLGVRMGMIALAPTFLPVCAAAYAVRGFIALDASIQRRRTR